MFWYLLQDMSSRVVKFIIPQSVERVQEQETQISDLISVIAGGQAVIQVRRSYRSGGLTGETVLQVRMSYRLGSHIDQTIA
jgi:hypothetical protein